MDTTRFSALFNITRHNVAIIGCGGLGSTLAVTLAKMGLQSLTLIDPETIEPENVATQFYMTSQVGIPKVYALQETCEQLSDDIRIDAILGRFPTDQFLPQQCDIIISAVDSITARKDIFYQIAHHRLTVAEPDLMFMDLRMSALELHIFCVTDHKRANLYHDIIKNQSDEMFPPVACTEKATFFSACACAGLAGSLIMRYSNEEVIPFKKVLNLKRGVMTEV